MAEITDLSLHHSEPANGSTRDSFIEPSARGKWTILAVLLLIAAAAIGYVVFRRMRPPAQVAPVAQAPSAVEAPVHRGGGPLVEAEKIDLPALPEMDALVRDLVVKLSSHPVALAWLSTKGLIENFTVATVNLSEGKTPVQHWSALKPKERFTATKTPRGMRIDPRSYRRYDQFAAAIGGLDPAGTARLYLTLKPRITESYRNLGFPEGDFDGVLERALATLLATPSIQADSELNEKVLSYGFVNRDIEALPSAQKQLLRMGPDNMRIVLTKLREIATQLGLHPEAIPPSVKP